MADLLEAARLLDCYPEQTVLLGVECLDFGFGLSALIQQKYTATLQYTGELGQLRTASDGEVEGNGLGSLLQDRGAVYLTLKTTF